MGVPCPVATPGDVRVKAVNGVRPPAKKYVRLDVGIQFGHVAPFTNSMVNYLHAVVCRAKLVKRAGIFQPRPPVAPGASYAPMIAAFRKHLIPCAIRPTVSSLRPLTRAEFVAGRPSGLRKVYQRAIDDRRFELRGLRDLTKLKGFVKVEKSAQAYIDSEGRLFCAKPPRPIHPRDPGFNIEQGRFTVVIEHHLYGDLAEICDYRHGGEVLPVVMKAYNVEDRARIIRAHWDRAGGDGKAFALCIDQSGFDAHIELLSLLFTHQVFELYFPGRPDLKRLLKAQLDNRVVARFRDGEVRTRLGPMRMSGDMDTSLGNCLISATLAWMLCRVYRKTSFVVDGDDTIIFVPRKLMDTIRRKVVDHYLSFGFDAVAEHPCDVFEHIEFCQSKPVFDGCKWRMVRNWHKAISLDYSGYERLLEDRYFKEFIHSVGSCGMALTYGLPIMQEFYSFGIREGSKGRDVPWDQIKGLGLFRLAKRAGGFRRWSPVTDAARISFWRAFGVTPDSQIRWERHFSEMVLTDDLVDVSKLPADHTITTNSASSSPSLEIITVPLQPFKLND